MYEKYFEMVEDKIVKIPKEITKTKQIKMDAKELLKKVITDSISPMELKYLHKKDSIVNDTLRIMTSEYNNDLTNEEKNILNKILFQRDKPKEIQPPTREKWTKAIIEEMKQIKDLFKNHIFINKARYIASNGTQKTQKGWIMAFPDYDENKKSFFIIVTEEEIEYFKEHGYFPLREFNENSKLGKRWLYWAFEFAWLCSGEANGGCQCPNFCYAKKMEYNKPVIRHRIYKMINAWKNHTVEEKIDFFTNWIMKGNYGVRFCDTGDVPNQSTLDEIFKIVRGVTENLKENGIDTDGRFYMYSTRADLDWSNKPWELVLNASNEELFKKVPDANWYRVVESWDDIPEEYRDPRILHICNCNCKACDYCCVCRNTVIWEILG